MIKLNYTLPAPVRKHTPIVDLTREYLMGEEGVFGFNSLVSGKSMVLKTHDVLLCVP